MITIMISKSEVSNKLWQEWIKVYYLPSDTRSIYITVVDYAPRDISGVSAFNKQALKGE